jgi:hypothetical protein
MTVEFPSALNLLSPRALLQGSGNADALENVNPTPLPDGALCWVINQAAFSYLDKTSVAAVSAPAIIATALGAGVPGRWIQIQTGGGGLPPVPDLNPYGLTALNGVVGWSRFWIAAGQLGPVPGNVGPVVILAAGHDPGLYTLDCYQRIINASAGVTGNMVTRVTYTELTTPPTPWGATLTQDSTPLSSLLNGQNSSVLVFPSDGSQDISIEKTGLTIGGPPGTALSYVQFFLSKRGPF